MNNKDSLGDRMKNNYENTTRYKLVRRMPVVIRSDARAFHSFTKSFNRPFDQKIIRAMVMAAKAAAEDMQGFRIGYIQSDEANFVLVDYNNLETEAWFDYNLNKVVSITASLMTIHFNMLIREFCEIELAGRKLDYATFDARAFNVPREEVSNTLLWRCKDWSRNSISMYARSFFSHEELENKSCSDMHEMLHSIGKNWTNDLSLDEKNGTFLVKREYGIVERQDVLPNYTDVSKLIDPLINPVGEKENDKEKEDTEKAY